MAWFSLACLGERVVAAATQRFYQKRREFVIGVGRVERNVNMNGGDVDASRSRDEGPNDLVRFAEPRESGEYGPAPVVFAPCSP
jgi:hypothetical protein